MAQSDQMFISVIKIFKGPEFSFTDIFFYFSVLEFIDFCFLSLFFFPSACLGFTLLYFLYFLKVETQTPTIFGSSFLCLKRYKSFVSLQKFSVAFSTSLYLSCWHVTYIPPIRHGHSSLLFRSGKCEEIGEHEILPLTGLVVKVPSFTGVSESELVASTA